MSHSSLLMRWIQMPSHPPKAPSSLPDRGRLGARLPACPSGSPRAVSPLRLLAHLPHSGWTPTLLLSRPGGERWGPGDNMLLFIVWEVEVTSWCLKRPCCPLSPNHSRGGKNRLLRRHLSSGGPSWGLRGCGLSWLQCLHLFVNRLHALLTVYHFLYYVIYRY